MANLRTNLNEASFEEHIEKTQGSTIKNKLPVTEKTINTTSATSSLASVGKINVNSDYIYWILAIIISSVISFWIGFIIGKKDKKDKKYI